jgi:hypothetical protein
MKHAHILLRLNLKAVFSRHKNYPDVSGGKLMAAKSKPVSSG